MFGGNTSPEMAFETGFAAMSGRDATTDREKDRLALQASLGTDSQNGTWHVLGGFSALSGALSVAEVWPHHAGLLDAPNETHHHIEGEARRVREETGLPVRALSQKESRAIKAMLSTWPPAESWSDFAAACDDLGCRDLAAQYARVSGYLWPEIAR